MGSRGCCGADENEKDGGLSGSSVVLGQHSDHFFEVASIAGYAMLSLVTNAPPAMSPSAGWVAVLQPGASPGTGDMLLQARA